MEMQTTMYLVGKRHGQSLVAAATGHSGGLLFLTDCISKQQFLVDTRAEVSVLPATGLDTRTKNPGQPLLAANGSSIRTYGIITEVILFLKSLHEKADHVCAHFPFQDA